MVFVKIATLRIHGVLKIGTPPAKRLGANLKIVRSMVNTATKEQGGAFLFSFHFLGGLESRAGFLFRPDSGIIRPQHP
jgi:hypothetical protein